MHAANSFKVLSKQQHGQVTVWSNNSRSACLMDDHPNSMRALVRGPATVHDLLVEGMVKQGWSRAVAAVVLWLPNYCWAWFLM